MTLGRWRATPYGEVLLQMQQGWLMPIRGVLKYLEMSSCRRREAGYGLAISVPEASRSYLTTGLNPKTTVERANTGTTGGGCPIASAMPSYQRLDSWWQWSDAKALVHGSPWGLRGMGPANTSGTQGMCENSQPYLDRRRPVDSGVVIHVAQVTSTEQTSP